MERRNNSFSEEEYDQIPNENDFVEKTETKTDFNINCMGTVKIGDKELTLKIGKKPEAAEE